MGTEALSPLTTGLVKPDVAWGAEEVRTDEEGETEAIKTYIKNQAQGVYHPIGTAGMMKREDGGVVDEKLVVYGTRNVRVVDASVIPIVSALCSFLRKEADGVIYIFSICRVIFRVRYTPLLKR